MKKSELYACVGELVQMAVAKAKDFSVSEALQLSQAALNSANALAVIDDKALPQAQEINPGGYDER